MEEGEEEGTLANYTKFEYIPFLRSCSFHLFNLLPESLRVIRCDRRTYCLRNAYCFVLAALLLVVCVLSRQPRAFLL